MHPPPITPEENERIARRERLVSRGLIAALVIAVLGMLGWGIANDSGPEVGPDPDEQPCMVSVCP